MASFPGTFDYAANESTNLQNSLARAAEIDDRKDTKGTAREKRYNTNVIINEGAYVGNYAYGGGLGKADDQFISSGDVYGTTYIALLGGKVNKDLYAAGTMGTVYNLFGADFTASANAYIKGGTCRNATLSSVISVALRLPTVFLPSSVMPMVVVRVVPCLERPISH